MTATTLTTVSLPVQLRPRLRSPWKQSRAKVNKWRRRESKSNRTWSKLSVSLCEFDCECVVMWQYANTASTYCNMSFHIYLHWLYIQVIIATANKVLTIIKELYETVTQTGVKLNLCHRGNANLWPHLQTFQRRHRNQEVDLWLFKAIRT